MSTFVNLEDYDASIHAEILDSLTRSDSALMEICEDRAIAEMRSYLRCRYDCDAMFIPDMKDLGVNFDELRSYVIKITIPHDGVFSDIYWELIG